MSVTHYTPVSALSCHAQWRTFKTRAGLFLHARRGRISDLARHLGVRRQQVHAWFFGRREMPAAAVIPTIEYIWRTSRPALSPDRETSLLELPFVTGSEDK